MPAAAAWPNSRRDSHANRSSTPCERAVDALSAQQAAEGFWCGELTADTTLESDYILLQLWLNQPDESGWNPPTRAAHRPGGPLDPGAPVAGWRVQHLRRRPLRGERHHQGVLRAEAGRHPAGERRHCSAARLRILALGGLQAANSYVKINLSLFGLYPRKHAPSVPPEIVMLPGNVLYEMSSWTRSILVPLSIVQARGANRRAPAGFNLDELLLPRREPGAAQALGAERAVPSTGPRLQSLGKARQRAHPRAPPSARRSAGS